MTRLNNLTLKKSVNKAYLKIKPVRKDFEKFKDQLLKLLSLINKKESEEHNKNFVRDFLINTFYSDKYVNTSGRTDLAINLDGTSKSFIGVIIETKSPTNKYDMISEDNLNCKAMHEAILYYLRERIEQKNDEIKNIIITNAYKWFIFKAEQFEKHFYKSKLKNEYEKWRDNKKVSKLNEHFYNEIVKKFLDKSDAEIEGVYFDLRDFEKYLNNEEEKHLIPLYKKLSPPELLKETFANDSNTLNKQFYTELLHIIGLEEYKEGSKKKIGRKDEKKRNNGSLLENTIRMLEAKDVIKNFDDISVYGSTEEEQLYNIALELNIVWINRILFLKLLEAQLVNYHGGDKNYKFLEPKVISQYDDLFELFHEVLAVKNNERNSDLVGKFNKIPYLNSSLFELSELEKKTINISELKDRFNLPYYKKTVFRKEIKSRSELPALDYLLLFLDAHDFVSENSDEILEVHKTIINSSVLGLIFEKINGYKEGSFYTPGFITMYMARETLRRAVVQKFNDEKSTSYKDYEELKKDIDTSSQGRKEANKIINGLKICDPAVGSGHFLVSCLNEIIAIKADLKILNYKDGRQVQNYSFEIENDELVIINEETDEFFSYHLNPADKFITTLQEMQETLFYEKETIIENCLFGVDINPNSVNICRLRLWIELLKNSYYTKESNYTDLETLPNIDINIKQGNSLISRFDVRQDIFTQADKQTLDIYKLNVALYKNELDRDKRRELKNSIEKTKERFRGIAVDPLYKEREQMEKLTEQLHKLNVDNPLFKHEDSTAKEAEVEKKRNNLSAKINKLSKEIEDKVEDYTTIYSSSFEWRFEFPEVLDDSGKFIGFDVVLANPPYISNWELSASNRNLVLLYQKLYKDYLTGHWDIFNCFIPHGYQLLRETGFLSYILPTSVLKEKHSTEIRNLLIDKAKILEVIDFQTERIFEDVARQICIILIQKEFKPNNEIILKHNLIENYKYVSQDFFKQLKNSIIKSNVTEKDVSIYEKLHTDSVLLGKVVCINTGVVAHSRIGSKRKFIKDDVIHKKFQKGFKKYVVGENLQPYLIEYENDYIDYELKREYFHRPKYPLLFESEKIIIRRISGKDNKFIACYDDEGYYSNDNLMHLIKWSKKVLKYQKPEKKWEITIDSEISLKYILAILNSNLNTYFFSKFISSDTLQGSYSSIYPEDIRIIPIKNVGESEQNKIIKLVDRVLFSKPIKDTSKLESDIDKMVYKLYGLTEEEIKIMEGT